MRFLLRCIFCLAVVYGAILRDDGLLPELVAPVAQGVPATRAAAGRRLVAGLGGACGSDPAACLEGAATVSRLLAATGGGPAPFGRHARDQGAVAAASPYMGR